MKSKKIVGGAIGGSMLVVYGVSLIFQNLHAISEHVADESNGEALAHRSIHVKLMHPLVPRLGESIINETDGKALAEFFDTYACPSDGPGSCILDLLSHTSSRELRDRTVHLRHLAKTIVKSKDTQCGSPRIIRQEQVIDIGTTDLEFCFWKDDYVSNEAMRESVGLAMGRTGVSGSQSPGASRMPGIPRRRRKRGGLGHPHHRIPADGRLLWHRGISANCRHFFRQYAHNDPLS